VGRVLTDDDFPILNLRARQEERKRNAKRKATKKPEEQLPKGKRSLRRKTKVSSSTVVESQKMRPRSNIAPEEEEDRDYDANQASASTSADARKELPPRSCKRNTYVDLVSGSDDSCSSVSNSGGILDMFVEPHTPPEPESVDIQPVESESFSETTRTIGGLVDDGEQPGTSSGTGANFFGDLNSIVKVDAPEIAEVIACSDDEDCVFLGMQPIVKKPPLDIITIDSSDDESRSRLKSEQEPPDNDDIDEITEFPYTYAQNHPVKPRSQPHYFDQMLALAKPDDDLHRVPEVQQNESSTLSSLRMLSSAHPRFSASVKTPATVEPFTILKDLPAVCNLQGISTSSSNNSSAVPIASSSGSHSQSSKRRSRSSSETKSKEKHKKSKSKKSKKKKRSHEKKEKSHNKSKFAKPPKKNRALRIMSSDSSSSHNESDHSSGESDSASNVSEREKLKKREELLLEQLKKIQSKLASKIKGKLDALLYKVIDKQRGNYFLLQKFYRYKIQCQWKLNKNSKFLWM